MRRKKKRVYIHYGESHFQPEKFGTIKNCQSFWVKPDHKTGMWASPVKTKFGWRDFCTAEQFQLDRLNSSFRFTLRNGARVAHVRSYADLCKLPKRDDTRVGWSYYIDFEQLAEQYDAIELHLTEDPTGARGELYNQLYGWDCDSILILNPDIVEEVVA